MTEHRPESAPPLPGWVKRLRRITLPAIPSVYGLTEPRRGVTAWVFALPDGQAYVISIDEDDDSSGGMIISTSLDNVASRWAPLMDAKLVRVSVSDESKKPRSTPVRDGASSRLSVV
ncbi:MAG: hypothetical protein ACR2GH_18775 [Pseudonocardia sp.]